MDYIRGIEQWICYVTEKDSSFNTNLTPFTSRMSISTHSTSEAIPNSRQRKCLFLVQNNFYHPQMKFGARLCFCTCLSVHWESAYRGLSGVCLKRGKGFVYRGGGLPTRGGVCLQRGGLPPEGELGRPNQKSGWYASYWNAFLFSFGF